MTNTTKGTRLDPAGIIIAVVGAVLALCGAGYFLAFYTTQGFADSRALQPLFDLGYLNAAIALGLLCLGVVVVIAGLLVRRRR